MGILSRVCYGQSVKAAGRRLYDLALHEDHHDAVRVESFLSKGGA